MAWVQAKLSMHMKIFFVLKNSNELQKNHKFVYLKISQFTTANFSEVS